MLFRFIRYYTTNNLSLFIKRQIGNCSFSEHKIQGLTSEKRFLLSGQLFIYMNYLTKIQGKDFKSAVLNSYYHGFSLRKQRYGKQQLIIVLPTSA